MSRVHLGINTCFAVKRWPDPDQWGAICADELGLSTVQLTTDLLPVGGNRAANDDYARRVRSAASTHGLTVHSLFTGLGAYSSALLLADDEADRDAALGWYREMLRTAAAAGARGMGGHLGALSVPAAADAQRTEERRTGLYAAMRMLAAQGADLGLDHLQFENLAVRREFGHSIAQAHDVERAMRGSAVPWVLCLDLGHPGALPESTGSTDIQDWLHETWVSTPVVQLQQAPRGSDMHGPFTAAANADGLVDRDRVLEAIASWEADDVYLFFEIIHSHEHDDAAVLDDLRASVSYWRSAIGPDGAVR